jgi:hypothetical protein
MDGTDAEHQVTDDRTFAWTEDDLVEHFTEPISDYGARCDWMPDEVRAFIRERRNEGESYDDIAIALEEATAVPDPDIMEPPAGWGRGFDPARAKRTPREMRMRRLRGALHGWTTPRRQCGRARSSLRSGRPRAAATATSRGGDSGDDGQSDQSDSEPPLPVARPGRALRRARAGVVA